MPRRLVRDPDGRIVAVDVLSAGTRRAESLDLQVLGVELDIDLVGFGKDGDGHRGGMDAAAGLGLGDALDAMDAAFVFQERIDLLALDRRRWPP